MWKGFKNADDIFQLFKMTTRLHKSNWRDKLQNTEKIKIFCKGINARYGDTAKRRKNNTYWPYKKGNEILKG